MKPQQQKRRIRQRSAAYRSKFLKNPVFSSIAFWILLILLGLAFLSSIGNYLILQKDFDDSGSIGGSNVKSDGSLPPHVYPRLPHLPIFPAIENEQQLVHQTLYENKPTIAGIAAILYRFLDELHQSNRRLMEKLSASSSKQDFLEVRDTFFDLVKQHLVPLDRAYQGRPLFEQREDDSIFVSVAAFREYLLADTLASLYGNAKNPDKLYVGVIVNNCFADNNNTDSNCTKGVKGVGKDETGRDVLQHTEDGVPDVNHIETFCQNTTFQHYCNGGQVRVLYLHDSDALGPAVARYYSSKLWGGETYYVQIDSHLRFATHWDELYIQEIKQAKSFPKAILSTYPPGFTNFRQNPPFTAGTRLCRCQIRRAEDFLPRVEMKGRCSKNATAPTQMAFVGAGFFFARAEILVDVPFDPFLAWMFMGEEIALSIRSWTHGWNIYAPRKNLIGHQYRNAKFGAPGYVGSVRRIFGKPMMVSRLTTQIRERVKHILGYPDIQLPSVSSQTQQEHQQQLSVVLTEVEKYGLGSERSREDYLKFAEIDLEQKTCGEMKWCTEGWFE